MEILGAPSGFATFPFRRPHCRYFAREPRACFFLCSGFLSIPSLPSPFRVQIQLHPWSKQLFCISPKAQLDDSNDVSALACLRRKVKAKEAVEQLDKQLLEGAKPLYVEYLMGLGLDLDDIRRIVGWYPCIQYCSVDKQIRPLVNVLLNVGVDHSSLLLILRRWPRTLTVSIEKRLLPTMEYLERLGLDKAQRVKALRRYPQLTTLTREKIEANMAYFLELGVTVEDVGKMTRLVPGIFGMSVENKFKPTTEFFLAKGFTKEALQTMVVKFPSIYTASLTKCLVPKWEFFLEMGYPTSDLAIFPQYFGCSLEGRIKPRYKLAMEHGVRLPLYRLLNTPNRYFGMLLDRLGREQV